MTPRKQEGLSGPPVRTREKPVISAEAFFHRWSENASAVRSLYLVYQIVAEEENKEECPVSEISAGGVSAFYYLGTPQTFCSRPPRLLFLVSGRLPPSSVPFFCQKQSARTGPHRTQPVIWCWQFIKSFRKFRNGGSCSLATV